MKRDYVIITDSTCDLGNDFVVNNNIEVIPLKYTINEKTYNNFLDEREQSFKDFYDLMRNGHMTSTSQINAQEAKRTYKKFLEKGLDILIISFSSGLSGSYNAHRLAINDLKEEYPDSQMVLIDSLCASMGEGLLVYYANKYKKEGKDISLNAKLLENLKLRVLHWFTVSDIDLLRRGGRVSGVSAFIAKTIKIKPVLHVNDEGLLKPKFKKIGRKQALNELVSQFEVTADRSFLQTVFISHGDSLDDANYVLEKIKKYEFVEDVVVNYIGPVIGSHSGPGTIALFFIGDKR